MSSESLEKLEEDEVVRIIIGKLSIDNEETYKEVVYKPATILPDDNSHSKFQGLKPENPEKLTSSFFLYRTVLFASFLAFSAAIGFSWTSPVLPKLHGPENPLSIRIDASQESIIASILSVGAALGPFPFGYLADKIGRKRTLIGTGVNIFVSTIILAFTDEVKMYYLARLLYGISNGGILTVLNMYVAEITEGHNRGQFSCIMGIIFGLGILFPYSVGPFLSVRNFCLSSLLPLTIFLVFYTIYCPDSPVYLVKKDETEAVSALVNLRDKSEDEVQRELKDLHIVLENQKNEKTGIAEIFRTRGTRKAFVVSGGLLIIQQLSGINAVISFLENIFAATGSSMSPQVATIFIGVVQVLTVMVTASVIDKLGRRFLLIFSIIGCSASLAFLGGYFFLQKHKYISLQYFWWLPVACLFVYIICYNLGLGPVPWTILSEIFPNNVKFSAAGLATFMGSGVSFLVTMAFPILNQNLGMAGSFWLFGISLVAGLIFSFLIVPETKGKTLIEIQQIFNQ